MAIYVSQATYNAGTDAQRATWTVDPGITPRPGTPQVTVPASQAAAAAYSPPSTTSSTLTTEQKQQILFQNGLAYGNPDAPEYQSLYVNAAPAAPKPVTPQANIPIASSVNGGVLTMVNPQQTFEVQGAPVFGGYSSVKGYEVNYVAPAPLMSVEQSKSPYGYQAYQAPTSGKAEAQLFSPVAQYTVYTGEKNVVYEIDKAYASQLKAEQTALSAPGVIGGFRLPTGAGVVFSQAPPTVEPQRQSIFNTGESVNQGGNKIFRDAAAGLAGYGAERLTELSVIAYPAMKYVPTKVTIPFLGELSPKTLASGATSGALLLSPFGQGEAVSTGTFGTSSQKFELGVEIASLDVFGLVGTKIGKSKPSSTTELNTNQVSSFDWGGAEVQKVTSKMALSEISPISGVATETTSSGYILTKGNIETSVGGREISALRQPIGGALSYSGDVVPAEFLPKNVPNAISGVDFTVKGNLRAYGTIGEGKIEFGGTPASYTELPVKGEMSVLLGKGTATGEGLTMFPQYIYEGGKVVKTNYFGIGLAQPETQSILLPKNSYVEFGNMGNGIVTKFKAGGVMGEQITTEGQSALFSSGPVTEKGTAIYGGIYSDKGLTQSSDVRLFFKGQDFNFINLKGDVGGSALAYKEAYVSGYRTGIKPGFKTEMRTITTTMEQPSEFAVASMKNINIQMPTQTPMQIPFQMPFTVETQVPTQIPIQMPKQTQFNIPIQTPIQFPTQTPIQYSKQTPYQVPINLPTQIVTQTPIQMPKQTPYNFPYQAPTHLPVQIPTQFPTQLPIQMPTQIPVQIPTQIPKQTPFQIPTQTPTQIPGFEIPPMPPPWKPGKGGLGGLFPSDSGSDLSGMRKKKQKGKYQPSFIALTLGLKTTKKAGLAAEKTGFDIRGIIGKKRK